MKKNLLISLSIALMAIVLFSCSKGGYSLKTDKSTYAPGETIKVEYNADGAWEKNAWIGIIPSTVAHGKESINDENDIEYKYLEKSTKGTFEFKAPSVAGKFDVRMNDSDDATKGVEINSVSFEVK